ncbi:L,D-transpeptidase [Consotaella aegiceratis]|uniref:L,D-transpeptidase n=1 Tax=Consotaella aegiceratis TaxID=3097961 RepID=UPI002F41141C
MRILGFCVACLLALATFGGRAEAGVIARIDLSQQRMQVYQDGKLAYTWSVSTARSGYRTPVGTYKPYRMHKMWYSRKYHMSPMPYSIFFLGGYAIHGTDAIRNLGHPASHGCIRLHPDNARKLFSLVKQSGAAHTEIVITR